MSNLLYVTKYVPMQSLIHALDPRVKIFFSAFMMGFIFLCNTWRGVLLLTFLIFSVIKLSRLPGKLIWPGIFSFRFILGLTGMAQFLIYSDPNPWVTLGSFQLGGGSLNAALFLIFRLILVLIMAQLLLLSTSTIQMTIALEAMLTPLQKLHFPTGELVMIITIAIRFLPLILEESLAVRSAQIARGADFSAGNLVERLKKQLMIIVPVFSLSLQRAGDLAESLESRSYVPGAPRSHLYALKLGRLDYLAFLVLAVMGAVVWIFPI